MQITPVDDDDDDDKPGDDDDKSDDDDESVERVSGAGDDELGNTRAARCRPHCDACSG